MRPLYSFSAGNSPLHKLDARTKLVMVLSYLVLALLLPQPWILFLLLIAIAWIFARIGPLEYYPFLLLMAPIIIAITLVHTIIVGGPPYLASVDLGLVTVHFSAPGFENGSMLAFRLGTMGLAFTMFSMTTEPFLWGMSMYKSGLNYKIAFMFAFALRFFPLFQEEFIVVQNALKARGADNLSSTNLFNPLKLMQGIGIATVPMALGAVRRSQDIALSMELRGLNIAEEEGVPRTLYRHIAMRPADYMLMAISVLSVSGAIVWKLTASI